MESIFTLAYPEYAIAEKLHKLFPKKKGYAILAPLSRQQKGVDLAIYNLREKKAVTIQVKASQAYMDNFLTRKGRRERFDNHFWYRVFDYEPENADFFFFFGLYVKPNFVGKKLNRAKSFNKYWDAKVIVYSDSEMKDFLKRLRTKRGKKELFFDFAFNNDECEIYLTRGVRQKQILNSKLLENRIADIKRELD